MTNFEGYGQELCIVFPSLTLPATMETLAFLLFLLQPMYAAKKFLRSVRRLLVAACVVPSSPIFVTLMKEVPVSPKTLVLTRATRRNNPEDTILHSHHRENLKSYTAQCCL
jgi:hypothetical protein